MGWLYQDTHNTRIVSLFCLSAYTVLPAFCWLGYNFYDLGVLLSCLCTVLFLGVVNPSCIGCSPTKPIMYRSTFAGTVIVVSGSVFSSSQRRSRFINLPPVHLTTPFDYYPFLFYQKVSH
eukprot:TRINITY_DN6464_c0_g1_i10.p1 TRINITY_DN6464_c0_g1~~TRINITY_DN6464_c0_g1_i10.p1  ORF type:complete len:120 (-),score=1.07 TRINITY_DN6464_c0_g1_i10:197-556(-)